ncbi:MAG: hypothetical protein Q7K47_10110 [Fusobacterium sp. JB019]|nr:hypothetical protein [Fusobacterium sp. JB020]MDP0507543.1 hypothetical protein [Fusobacterium sp. JB019]
MINQINSHFKHFDTMYANRYKYRQKWILEHSQEELETIIHELKDHGLCQEKKIFLELKLGKYICGFFQKISFLINLLEILISVAIVFLASNILKNLTSHIESKLLSFYFVLIFFIVKAVIDRTFVRKIFDEFNWKIFKFSYLHMKNFIIKNVLHINEKGEF